MDQLHAVVTDNLTEEERETAAVYFDCRLLPAGTAEIGGRQVTVDHPYHLAFIDQNPGANWMHPCRYMLINPASNTILLSIQSDRPPAFGTLPSSWRVLLRPLGLEEWKVMPIASDTASPQG